MKESDIFMNEAEAERLFIDHQLLKSKLSYLENRLAKIDEDHKERNELLEKYSQENQIKNKKIMQLERDLHIVLYPYRIFPFSLLKYFSATLKRLLSKK